jgi:hypothetical protein
LLTAVAAGGLAVWFLVGISRHGSEAAVLLPFPLILGVVAWVLFLVALYLLAGLAIRGRRSSPECGAVDYTTGGVGMTGEPELTQGPTREGSPPPAPRRRSKVLRIAGMILLCAALPALVAHRLLTYTAKHGVVGGLAATLLHILVLVMIYGTASALWWLGRRIGRRGS